MARIRLSKSVVGSEEKEAIGRVIDAGYLGMGDEVRLLEEEVAAYIGGDRQVICVSSGTAALHLAVSGLDIGPGDEVIVPSITYVACFQAISATGARPVACDVRVDDVFMDCRDAERRLTSRTRAVMPVHYASGTAGLPEVYNFARANGLRVIEDAAHSFGGDGAGGRVGATGDVVCFSFDGIKNITSGEGGAVVTSDLALSQRIRDARLVGVERDTEARYSARRSWTFDVHHQGYRYHMSNIMAAVGRAQLRKIDGFAARRRELARRYVEELSGLNSIALLKIDLSATVPHIFVIRVQDGFRDELARWLNERDIETGFHYQPNHRLSLFATPYALDRSDTLAEELITLPLHPELTDNDQGRVIGAIKDFLQAR